MCEQHRGLTEHGRWTGEVRLVPEALEKPLRWRKPRRVLVPSMGDLFADGVSHTPLNAVFAWMAVARQHTFLVLTKRIKRAAAMLKNATGDHLRDCANNAGLPWVGLPPLPKGKGAWLSWDCPWPPQNIVIGCTVENQRRADERLPVLAEIASMGWRTWVSVEPLLEAVDLALHCWIRVKRPIAADWPISAVMYQRGEVIPTADKGVYKAHSNQHGALSVQTLCGLLGVMPAEMERLHPEFVAVGAETGAGARPCDDEWIRSVVEQVRFAAALTTIEYGPRCHVKQLSGSGNPAEWPEDLRVRELVEVR
jgi:protein gp37